MCQVAHMETIMVMAMGMVMNSAEVVKRAILAPRLAMSGLLMTAGGWRESCSGTGSGWEVRLCWTRELETTTGR